LGRKTITLLAYGLPVLLFAGVMAFTIFRPILVMPRVGIGPGFGLNDLEGNKVTNETMRGKVVLYSFTYTSCDTGCDLLMQKMQEVRERLYSEVDLEAVDFEMITITIDPERDPPDVLAEYAAQYGAVPNQNSNLVPWRFVTGADHELVKIMVSSGFDLYHERIEDEDDPENYQFKFVPMAVMIDGWGIIRSEYRQYEATERLSLSEGTTDIDPDIILRDIGLIADEVRNSKGLASAAYEAAHLFACYPP
jgi:protein SCO1/2